MVAGAAKEGPGEGAAAHCGWTGLQVAALARADTSALWLKPPCRALPGAACEPINAGELGKRGGGMFQTLQELDQQVSEAPM